jgi:hypothetical protein
MIHAIVAQVQQILSVLHAITLKSEFYLVPSVFVISVLGFMMMAPVINVNHVTILVRHALIVLIHHV